MWDIGLVWFFRNSLVNTHRFLSLIFVCLPDLILPVNEDHSVYVILGVLLCLRHVVPHLNEAMLSPNSKGNSVIQNEEEMVVTKEQLLKIYELVLHFTNHPDHNVITATLETLYHMLKCAPKVLQQELVSTMGITKSLIFDIPKLNRAMSESQYSMVPSLASIDETALEDDQDIFVPDKQTEDHLSYSDDEMRSNLDLNGDYDITDNVCFGDESTFEILQNKAQFVRHRCGETFHSDCVVQTVKHPTKIMIWSVISGKGTGRLYMVKGMMRQDQYKDVLQNRSIPQLEECFPKGEPYIFMQDGAPCHTARSIKAFLAEQNIPLLDWPGNSPDMNTIENVLELMKREVAKDVITNKTLLLERIIHMWNHPQMLETVQSCIDSMPRRIKALIAAKGGTTKY
ncbi:transposable element Tcb2 transposase [Trichonephila clavipes]|nr:transposable element Tcb2 transposase [Trichonephila clavipes]